MRSYSHVRTVPRTVHELAASDNHSSHAYQSGNFATFPADQPDRTENMAHRPHDDGEIEDEQFDHGRVSLAGIFQVQSNRRKDNKSWRPMQANDLGESESIGDNSTCYFENDDAFIGVMTQDPFDEPYARLSVLSHSLSARDYLGNTHDGTNADENLGASAKADGEGDCPAEMQHTIAEARTHVFGNLPDPIRLHEQMGKFDGEVVFISHPNRDISAHQWSLSCFQWTNIGRYSYSRCKVEGSLASDRLRDIDELHDTLEYFKLAAESRQTLVVENGRTKEYTVAAGNTLDKGTEIIASNCIYTDTSTANLRVVNNIQGQIFSPLHSTVRAPLTENVLEDPFVAPARVSLLDITDSNEVQDSLIALTGSLDLTYRFPGRVTTNPLPTTGAGTLSTKSTGSSVLKSLSGPSLHEVASGEAAAPSRHLISVNNNRCRNLHWSTSQKPFRGSSQLPNDVDDSTLTVPAYEGLPQSVADFCSVVRYAVPAGTIMPINYTSSNLSAAAMPYIEATTTDTDSAVSDSSASTVNAPAIGLHYSDPDGLRRTQQHDVANGLIQQAPTLQSFKGPFFTESKPTTHDPTAALTVHVNEEEKLVNWFRDGQRPARQREYTKSLIGAAAASDKFRHFGAIGETSAKKATGPYANTGPFVRLYENFSEYVEEYRNGSGQSYFTRRWRPGTPQLREAGSDSSNSYFSKGSARLSWPRAALLRRSERMWG